MTFFVTYRHSNIYIYIRFFDNKQTKTERVARVVWGGAQPLLKGWLPNRDPPLQYFFS
jgi:hypothetical protein